jgi:hypothetical protein
LSTTTCRVVDQDGDNCGTPASGFACKAHIAELRRMLAGANGTPGVQSLAHELSLLATKQTRVHRANARAVPDEEFADLEEEYGWRRVLIPPHLRTREGRITLPTGVTMVNEHARDLLAALTNTIVTWARHIAETRGVPLDVPADAYLAGPTCRAHVHDFRPAVPAIDRKAGCGLHRDADGDYACAKHWCDHETCAEIRAHVADPQHSGVVAWLVDNLEAVRFDEAAPELIAQIRRIHGDATRAVDRFASRVFLGLCHAKLTGGGYCQRELYALPGWDTVDCDGWEPWEPGQQLTPGCGRKHDRVDRQVWMRQQFEDRNHTIADGLTFAPQFLPEDTKLPSRAVLIAAARRERMPIKGLDEHDEPLFSGTDLLAVITAWRPREYVPRPNHHKRKLVG